jgi:hypothetical protein
MDTAEQDEEDSEYEYSEEEVVGEDKKEPDGDILMGDDAAEA